MSCPRPAARFIARRSSTEQTATLTQALQRRLRESGAHRNSERRRAPARCPDGRGPCRSPSALHLQTLPRIRQTSSPLRGIGHLQQRVAQRDRLRKVHADRPPRVFPEALHTHRLGNLRRSVPVSFHAERNRTGAQQVILWFGIAPTCCQRDLSDSTVARRLAGSIAGKRYSSGSIASKSSPSFAGSTCPESTMLRTSARSKSKPRSSFDSACE